MKKCILFLLSILLLQACQPVNNEPADDAYSTWRVYHGDATASHYSSLNQINKGNVNQIELSWIFTTGDSDERSQIQCNPIIIDDILYATSPQLKLFALDATSGKQKWLFDPFAGKQAQGVNRGVVYWQSGNDERILFTAGSTLYALDAKTGQKVANFGKNGTIDLHDGLDRDVEGFDVIATTPGIVYKDLLILGSRVSEGQVAAPGHIRAFDIKTGERVWIFHTIPHPGEYGYDTWPEDAWKEVGGANAWSGFSLDEERGIVYVPTGSPSFDFHGGNRHGDNLFGNSLVALKAGTGERIWHFQTIHHDLWDRDLPSQPNLITVTHNGQEIDAVAQVTKHGMTFLFDRVTGEPLFPIEEKSVPGSDLLKEQTAATQPYPLKPPPFSRQQFSEDLISNVLPGSRDSILAKIVNTRFDHKFTPPSQEGTIIYPGFDGGADWGGAAVDPGAGILYINAAEMPWLHQMVPLANLAGAAPKVYMANCAACHGADRTGFQHVFPSLIGIKDRLTRAQISKQINTGKGRMPGFSHLPDEEKQELLDFLLEENQPEIMEWATKKVENEEDLDIPYTFTGYRKLVDQYGYPGVKPPWGTLNAIDLNKGELIWQVPLGELTELTEKGIPPTGTESYGGPVVTAGGIIFIAGTKDEKIRAFDQDTGNILWEYQLPAAGYATPATYEVNGKQYIVIAAGGGKLGTKSGDAYLAFALPE